MIKTLTIGSTKLEFAHTAVNKDAHLFIDGYHNPKVCPECIQPNTLNFAKFKRNKGEDNE